MEIKTIPVEQINPAPYNPRKDLQPGDPEYEKLKRSIEEFGFVEPLVWNRRTGNLVGGHQRFKILLAQGAKEVECSVVDLDEIREKALNIALNKIEGDWDMPKLRDLLQELSETSLDLEITGFDEDEIENLLAELDIDEFFRDHEESVDEEEEAEEKVICPNCGHEFEP
jgi:ParB-like chromosome segregation protein Spo0J